MNKKVVLVLMFLASFLVLPLAIADSSNAVTEFTSYGDQLSEDERMIYGVCIDPYQDHSVPLDRDWDDPSPTVSIIDMKVINTAVKAASLDYPSYFWLWATPILDEYTLSFFVPEFDITTIEVITQMKAFVSNISGETVSEKIAAIDSELRSKVEYVNHVPEDDVSYDLLDGTAYGAIVKGKANSYGFAAAVTFCAQELDIDVITIFGELNDPKDSKVHGWNLVQDEGWYGVDVALNKEKVTDTYVMMAAYDLGYKTDYTFKASHNANMSKYLDKSDVIFAPELHIRIIEPPTEPTFIEKYGQEILVIIIITVLCVVMLTYVKRG